MTIWLIIYKEGVGWPEELEHRVFATQYNRPPEGGYNEELYDIKEWDGPEPDVNDFDPDAMQPVLPCPDPTLTDPDYQDKLKQRVDFEALADKATAEIAWLEATIPAIDAMTLEELRGVLRRVCQENKEMLQAWRYVIRRLG